MHRSVEVIWRHILDKIRRLITFQLLNTYCGICFMGIISNYFGKPRSVIDACVSYNCFKLGVQIFFSDLDVGAYIF